MLDLLKRLNAYLPLVLSLIMECILLYFLFRHGTPVREKDEGVGAHLFQIWLAIEVILIAYFAVTWLPRSPKQALVILLVQIAAVIVVCAPVFYFNL
jgi:hypothetical protein